jgi:hypothetical protein
MSEINAEQGVTAPATVVPGLGYPNNRVENRIEPTGWQASNIQDSGVPEQGDANLEKIKK